MDLKKTDLGAFAPWRFSHVAVVDRSVALARRSLRCQGEKRYGSREVDEASQLHTEVCINDICVDLFNPVWN
ncbi:MAG: hypothetical protein ABSA52_06570 [Candidatus Binatia bacterium]|jgi:hypothetical protein